MLLTARRILLIHILMRLPDFFRPAIDAADRFVQRLQISKLFGAFACLTNTARAHSAARFGHRTRQHLAFRLARSATREAA